MKYEVMANKLHIELCGECAHDVTFEQKIVKALKQVESDTLETAAKKAKKFCDYAGCNSINQMGNDVAKAIRTLKNAAK